MSPSPNSRKVEATAIHLGLPLEVFQVDLTKGEHMSPEFTALNPNNMIPLLEDGDFKLWESNAILIYLSNKKPEAGLFPADPVKQVEVLRWLFWQSSHWAPACGALMWEHMWKAMVTGQPADDKLVAEAEGKFKRFGKVLNDHMADREWLVGESVTLADFAVGAFMTYADGAKFPYQDMEHVKNWLGRLEKLEAWQQTRPKISVG